MIGCLRTCVRKQPIIALYFEFENEFKFKHPIIALYFEFETALKFYNLGARLGSNSQPLNLQSDT